MKDIKIETAQDLIDAIIQHPQFREEVLRHLLTQELLQLPAKFEQFQEEFSQFRDEFVQFRDQTNRRLGRLEGNVADLRGNDYERSIRFRVRERAIHIFALKSPRIALSQNDPLSRELDSAINRARSRNEISISEIESILDTDIIISDEQNNHAAVEASITADQRDIARARERADILTRITGGTAHAIVAAQTIPDELRQSATAQNVAIMRIEYQS